MNDGKPPSRPTIRRPHESHWREKIVVRFPLGQPVGFQPAMIDDAELLRRYVEENSEAAFAELVHRGIDLARGLADRRPGERHRCRPPADFPARQIKRRLARAA